jgi:ParB-like chromosome segregation protein Spo0J
LKAKEPRAVLSKHCTAVAAEVDRKALKNADYNPRRDLTDKEREKLKASLATFGVVDFPVWNKRTGNIIGGHQRIAILDSLEKSDNYRLIVAQVDVDQKTEKELNIALNNTAMQSDFDLEKLGLIIKDIDFKVAGFDEAALMQMFGDDVFKGAEQAEALAELNEQVRQARENYDKLKSTVSAKRDDADFYCVLVFESQERRAEFAEALGLPDNKWMDGDFVARKLAGIASQEQPSPHAAQRRD